MHTASGQSALRRKGNDARALDRYGSQLGRLTKQRLSELALVAAKQEAERHAEQATIAMRDAQAATASLQEEMNRRLSTEARLAYVSNHDLLTGLLNRSSFTDRVAREIRVAQADDSRLALMSVDVNQFKGVNESLGHNAGDTLLRQIGERLTQCVGEADVAARLGGDEFAVLYTRVSDADAVRAFADQVISAFSPPFEIAGHPIFVSLSLGIALFPDDATDAQQLQGSADLAMSRAKELGRNGYQFFDLALNDVVHRRAKLEQALRAAIARRQLFIAYQPQVDVETANIVGVEALARWTHQEFGSVSPVEFIPLAERSGLITELGTWVLHESCVQAMRWRAMDLEPLTVAVNLSVPQIQSGDVTRVVSDILRDTGLPASQLELEITESGVMNDLRDGAAILADLRQLGVTLAIDDFGTGYSSLSYLRSLPVHRIKIDRSFIADVTRNRDAAAIASTIVSLAHNLRLDVIAEGVETEGHAAFVKSIFCDAAQGFYYGRPMLGDAIAALLQRQGSLAL